MASVERDRAAEDLVGVGMIGLGFMGATHVRAYLDAARDGFACELIAVCDNKASRREGFLADVGGNIGTAPGPADAFDLRRVATYSQAEDLLADRDVDLVSICTPTDTHAELAIAALRAGKHVLVEKPVALRADDIRRVDRVARETGKLCMPAMCMRFWPAWAWLKQRIDDRAFGRCTALTLTRISAEPTWSSSFYGDASRSGGALIDLHIHDADFVRYCFGDPAAVSSSGTVQSEAINHITTIYRFEKKGSDPFFPAHVVAEGAWLAPGTAFRMRYLAAFEGATAEFELLCDPELLLYREGRAEPVEVGGRSGYDEEIRHIVQTIAQGRSDLRATIADAIAVAELLDAERRSLERGEIVQVSLTR